MHCWKQYRSIQYEANYREVPSKLTIATCAVWELFFAETIIDFVKLDYLYFWTSFLIVGFRLMSFALHMVSLISIYDPARINNADGTRNFMILRFPILFTVVFSEFFRPFLLLNIYSLFLTNAALWLPQIVKNYKRRQA